MLWLYLSLFAAAFFAMSNIMDSYLVNHVFKKKVLSTIFFVNLLKSVLILVFVLLFFRPSILNTSILPYVLAAGVLDILYLIPFMKSLEGDDTSEVSSLFSLQRVFVPILAFFFLGEILTRTQYIGIGVTITAGILITLHQKKGSFQFDKAAKLMILASFLSAVQALLYRHVFTLTDWATGVFWFFFFVFLSLMSLFLISRQKRQLLRSLPQFRGSLRYVFFAAIISAFGWMALTYAVSLAEVSLVKAAMSAVPFFVLFYAILFEPSYPEFFKENIHRKRIYRKLLLFLILILGMLLLLL